MNLFNLSKSPKIALIMTGAVFMLAACGAEEGSSSLPTDQPLRSVATTEANVDLPINNSEYQATQAMDDIVDPKDHPIDEVVFSEDSSQLLIRYTAASEPCSGAIATVDNDLGTVTLVTGLHPNAAAMSCLADQIGYELAVDVPAPAAGAGSQTFTYGEGRDVSRQG